MVPSIQYSQHATAPSILRVMQPDTWHFLSQIQWLAGLKTYNELNKVERKSKFCSCRLRCRLREVKKCEGSNLVCDTRKLPASPSDVWRLTDECAMVNNKQFLHGSVSRYKHGLTWRRLTVQSLFPQCRLLECTQLPCLHKSAAASPWNNARHSIWKIVSQYFHIFLWRVQKELSLAFSKDFFWARIVFLLPTRQFVCISCETLPLVTSPELGVSCLRRAGYQRGFSGLSSASKLRVLPGWLTFRSHIRIFHVTDRSHTLSFPSRKRL